MAKNTANFLREIVSYSDKKRDCDTEGLVTIKYLPQSRSVQSRVHGKSLIKTSLRGANGAALL